MKSWEIRPEYIKMVGRYNNEANGLKKIQMKYKFIEWMKCNHYQMTDAEKEYLTASICFVEDVYDI